MLLIKQQFIIRRLFFFFQSAFYFLFFLLFLSFVLIVDLIKTVCVSVASSSQFIGRNRSLNFHLVFCFFFPFHLHFRLDAARSGLSFMFVWVNKSCALRHSVLSLSSFHHIKLKFIFISMLKY